MSIKSLLFILFLYVCLAWVGSAYFYSGAEFRQAGLLWTGVGLLALLLLMTAARLLAWFRARRAAASAAPRRRPPTADPVNEDDAALRAIMQEANATLAKIPAYAASHGSSPISTLPLYLLIGPPESGKTATFLNSGLEPVPLAAQPNSGSPSGSRAVCTFWLARNSLFVEISGRVYNGEAERWAQTLRLLRGGEQVSGWRALWGKAPATAQLRGVVGFCDAKEFTSAASDPQRFERYCKAFQDRLRTIGEVFGAQYPVYQVIAKSDGIPYFPDFFEHLPESDAAQVLGYTLSPADASPAGKDGPTAEAQRLTSAFRELYHTLAERRIDHLLHEPDPRRRPAVYEFPRELKRIRTPLVQFLTDVFRPNPLVPGPILRGFYLTARREVEVAEGADAHQSEWSGSGSAMESTKLFRTADATQLFRAPDATQLFRSGDAGKLRAASTPRRLAPRWMFATDLFHSVVLADRVAAARPVQRHPYERERRAVVAGICAVCGLLAVAFGISWRQNRQLLGKVSAVTDAALQKRQNVATMQDLEPIDNLRAEIVVLRQGASLSYHWGLYSGDRILPAAREVYFRRFQQLLLNDLNSDLVGRLRAASANSDSGQYDTIYRALKAHLMITSGSCRLDSAAVAQALKEARQRMAPSAAPAWQGLVDRQIDFYASEMAYGNPCRLAEDAVARDSGREYLRRVKGVDRIYRGVLASAEPGLPKPQRLADLAQNYRAVLNGPADIPPVFSRGAWDSVQKASKDAGSGSLGEACVVGGGAGDPLRGLDSGLQATIQQMYVSDYIEHWRKYVTGFSIVRYQNAADAAHKLDLLSDHSSPLLALFALVGNQTNFPSAAGDSGMLEQVPVVGALVKKAGKAKEQAEAVSGKQPVGPPLITRSFQPVQWVVPPGGDTWIVERNAGYVNALAELGHSMQALANGALDPTIYQQAQQAYDKALEASSQVARGFRPVGVDGLDQAAKRLLDEPIVLAKPFIINSDKAAGEKVNSDLRLFCNSARNLFRKYPFQPKSTDEASPEEITAMFAPGTGELWKFQAKALADLVVKDGAHWKAKDPAKKPQVTQEMIDFLNRAESITAVFFPKGATAPHFTYSLRPKMDSNDVTLELDIDGNAFPWTSKLQKQFSWPAPAGTRNPGVVGREHIGAVVVPFASRPGLWAIFRIMADAEPRTPGSPTVEWKYLRGGSGRPEPIEPPVRLEFVDFPGGVDIFNPRFFEGFQCPMKAVQ